MKERFVDLAVAAVVLGLVQAVVETLLLGWLARDLLLAPYRFFPTHAYDAFAKLYFLAADSIPLPLLLQDFLRQGFAPKLAIAPELAAINVAVAIVVAAILAPVAGVFGIGRRARGRSTARALAVVVAVCMLVHVATWLAAFHFPESVTPFTVLRATFRDVIQGGAGLAVGVLAVAAVLARLTLSSAAATGGASLVAAGLVVTALVPARTADLPGFMPNAWTTEALARVGDPPAATDSRGEPSDARAALAPAAGYNVILVSIDSLRADHLGAYGYARDTSPAIDAMARNGVLFRHSISTTSWTLPAHMSLLTARSLLGHGVISDDRSLAASVPTVAESFQKGGYETHAIVSAPYVNSRYGFARGFDEYDDRTIHFETNEDSYRSVTAPALLDATETWLDRPRDRPFFLFLHFWDVHYDYAPGPPYDTMFDPGYTGTVDGNNFYFDPKINKSMNRRDLEHLVALYDGEIRLVDDHLARLKAKLSALGIGGRTIVAIVADHGDEFFEHGNKGHHRTLYEEVLHTPFVLEVPGVRPSSAVVDSEVSLLDVAPTLLGLVGLAPPDGAEGRDFSGLYTGKPLPDEGAVHAELYRTGTRNVQVASIEARRKVIHHFQRRALETYDLAADPGEQTRLAPAGPVATPLVANLGDWLDARWHSFDKRARTEGITPVVLDAKTAEQLRSLGYLQ